MIYAFVAVIMLMLILLLMLTSIKILISYTDKLDLTIKVGVFEVYPRKKSVSKKTDDKDKLKAGNNTEYIDKLKSNLTKIKTLISDVFSVFKKHLVFEKIELNYDYGYNDAALTGVFYGVASATINIFLAYLNNTFKVKNISNKITPHFNEEVQKFEFYLSVKLKTVFLFGIGFKLLKFIKNIDKKVEL